QSCSPHWGKQETLAEAEKGCSHSLPRRPRKRDSHPSPSSGGDGSRRGGRLVRDRGSRWRDWNPERVAVARASRLRWRDVEGGEA
ncbi:hypothetical protein VIGAN_01254800, partial [Vigna angularis var. angularis]